MQAAYLFALAAVALTGCNQAPAPRYQVDGLQVDLDQLKAKVDRIDRARIEALLKSRDTVTLDANDTGYSVVETDLVPITMRIKKVAASGNGSKVSILVGNPNSASIASLKMKLSWGPNDEHGLPIEDKRRTEERTISQVLPAGRWSTIDIGLSAISPQALGYVQVSDVVISQILLAGSTD